MIGRIKPTHPRVRPRIPRAPDDVAPLDAVLRVNELSRRPVGEHDIAAENAAHLTICGELLSRSDIVLQSVAGAALSLCAAGTAGISVLEDQPDGTSVFRWSAVAGRLASSVNGIVPRDFSPCGVCLDRDEPVLFAFPERRFTYFLATHAPFVEALTLPVYAGSRAVGTIWLVLHESSRRFDTEDVRILARLGAFAGTAYGARRRVERNA